MIEPKISVVIPVGPKPSHKQWLKECIDSVMNQTVLPQELLLIDDMGHINLRDYFGANISTYPVHLDATTDHNFMIYEDFIFDNGVSVSKFNMPWLGGVVCGFNFGVALAKNEWVLQLGSDDILYPDAIKYGIETIKQIGDPLGLYNFSCYTKETGNPQVINWYNHANIVSKSLWAKSGGLHPMTITGGMDAALVSIMMIHLSKHLHKIKDGTPLYFVRSHKDQYTLESASKYGDFMVQLRNDLTNDWIEPDWTK
jgi:glycosyltransferase involved in cell wall biosynthesis